MTDKKRSPAGDDRTPDRRIGQVAYADNTDKKSETPASKGQQKSNLEGPAAYAPHEKTPEKQGGMGGP